MQKSMFERFISKYNLGGSCESVIYSVEENNISTRSISDDKNVLCEISSPIDGFPNGSYAIYETAKLRSMLGVLGDDLNVNVQTTDEIPTSIKLSDSSTGTVVTFVLADPSVIRDVPTLKSLPPFDVTVTLDKEFTSTFVKAKGALSEVDTFTIISEAGNSTADIVLGHSTLNTNRIKLAGTKHDAATSINPISFSANYFREILVANRDAGTGTLEVSSRGLARVKFEVDGVVSTYYLVEISV